MSVSCFRSERCFSSGSEAIDATNNWWNSATGPNYPGFNAGSGDLISNAAGTVQVSPFLTALKRSNTGQAVSHRRRAAPGHDPLEAVEREGRTMIDHLTKVRDRITLFRDRKITIDELIGEPAHDQDDEEFADFLDEFVDSMMEAHQPRRRRRGRR